MTHPRTRFAIGMSFLLAGVSARSVAAEPATLDARVGIRALHRSFDYQDPLADHDASAQRPFSSEMPLGPSPFLDVGLYPLRWAGLTSSVDVGVIAGYERLIGTSTKVLEQSLDTSAQQLYAGLRGRLALGEHQLGLSAAYGQHRYYTENVVLDGKAGTLVPNVSYSYVRLAADVRFQLGPVGLGATLGTRLVNDTGPLQADWFPSTSTRAYELGAFASYRLFGPCDALIGVDYLRYSFDFNPVSASSPVIAGGAVDQYLSGWLGLSVQLGNSP